MPVEKAIEVLRCNSKPIYTDNDTGAHLNCAVYVPRFEDHAEGFVFCGYMVRRLPDGHNYVGDDIVKKAAPEMWIFRALEGDNFEDNEHPPFCKATKGKLLWRDNHSGGSQDIAVYEPKPEIEGYVALGCLIEVTGKESGEAMEHFRCVRPDLVSPAKITGTRKYGVTFDRGQVARGPAWDDAGAGVHDTGGWADMAFWKVVAGEEGGLALPGVVASHDYTLSGARKPGACVPEPYVIKSGVYTHLGERVHWQRDSLIYQEYYLTDFCLPATHDTGTYSLIDEMGRDEGNTAKDLFGMILQAMKVSNKEAAKVDLDFLVPGSNVYRAMLKAVIDGATAQTRTVEGQLVDGIRGLDLRIYVDPYEPDLMRIGHGLLGVPMEEVLSEVKEFLDSSETEFLHVSIGHWTHFTQEWQYEQFFRATYFMWANHLLTPREARKRTPADMHVIPDFEYRKDIQAHGRSRVFVSWAMPGADANATNEEQKLQYQFLSKRCPDPENFGYPAGDDVTYETVVNEVFWDWRFNPPVSPLSGNDGVPLTFEDYYALNPLVWGAYTKSTDPQQVFKQQKEFCNNRLETDYYRFVPFAYYATLTPSDLDLIGRVILAASDAGGPTSMIVKKLEEIIRGHVTLPNGIKSDGWNTLEDLAQRINPHVADAVLDTFNGGGVYSQQPFLIYVDHYDKVPYLMGLCENLSMGQPTKT